MRRNGRMKKINFSQRICVLSAVFSLAATALVSWLVMRVLYQRIPEYDEFVTGYTTWTAYYKQGDMTLAYLVIGGILLFFVVSVLFLSLLSRKISWLSGSIDRKKEYRAGFAEKYEEMEKSQLQGSLLMPHSLEQLEQHSDCIVQGVLQNDAETCVTADPRFEWAMPSSGATKSTLTVTTILKGDGLLSIGDAISLYEPYYVYEVEGEPRLLYYSYYCPSEPGKTYLFFLNQNDAGG